MMLELSMHILDIVENSTRAGANLVEIRIVEDPDQDRFAIKIIDNGSGMDEKTLREALDPFFTTKKVRRVGLGLPMLKQAAQQAGGNFSVVSKPGGGTRVTAEFRFGHIDRQPLGDIVDTLALLIAANPETDFVYNHWNAGRVFRLDTRHIRKEIGDIPVGHPEVLKFIKDTIREGLEEIGKKIR